MVKSMQREHCVKHPELPVRRPLMRGAWGERPGAHVHDNDPDARESGPFECNAPTSRVVEP